MSETLHDKALDEAAATLRRADALLIAAGAGLGLDSGLPDVGDDAGLHAAYPFYAHLELRLADLATPRWFGRDPGLVWGFFGDRLARYRACAPHGGYQVLRRWAAARPSFVFTSNVDGHFLRAGFEPEALYEVHGSSDWLQCSLPCQTTLWPMPDALDLDIDPDTLRARDGTWPSCPACGRAARPNQIMANDWTFVDERVTGQHRHYRQWLADLHGGHLVIVELGASTATQTVRAQSEHLLEAGASLIRINAREPQAPHGAISLPLGAREALEALEARLS